MKKTRKFNISFLSDREVAAGIQWSEYLDLLFVNNYESDSSLSWQYYGATSGFLRRFPGNQDFFSFLLSLISTLSFRHRFSSSPSNFLATRQRSCLRCG